MTRFKAIRNFLRRPGETVMAGDVLTLDDTEASLLVNLRCVEPIDARDRKRVVSGNDAVQWQLVAQAEPIARVQPVGAFARKQ